MVMNGYDTDGDGENNFYTVNGRAFYYAKYPIHVKRGELVRIYLANSPSSTINSLHIHANFFRYYLDRFHRQVPRVHGHGHALPGAARDPRARVPERRPLHVPRTNRSSRSSAGWASSRSKTDEAGAATGSRRGWQLWALLPILLLVGAVSLAAAGGSITDLVGSNPPPADELDIRCVSFKPGSVEIRVTNPQRDAITIGTVTVADAIVPYTVDCRRHSSACARRRSSSPTIKFRTSPSSVGVTRA